MLGAVWLSLPFLLPVDFQRPDLDGRIRACSDWGGARVVVLYFLGADCPAARSYAKRLEELSVRGEKSGIAVIGVAPNEAESDPKLREWQTSTKTTFPILRDPGQILCRRLGITRTPEVAVLDAQRRLRYRGKIDDQFGPGMHGARPGRAHLQIAIDELISDKPVSLPCTAPTGCPLQPLPKAATGSVTWRDHIASIMQKRCVECHRAGGIAPFPLTTAAEARKHVRAIREAVEEKRMPPWHADSRFGKFANDPSLSDEECRLIDAWARAGGPAGNDVVDEPLRTRNSNEWRIGSPDAIFSTPKFDVPATGTLPYQHFAIPVNFAEDRWIQAAELRPGNRAVVHHATMFLRPAGHSQAATQGELQSFSLLTYAPGTAPLELPQGMAKKLPRGWELLFVVHYVTSGKPETDQTSLAVRFADPKSVRKEVATNLLISEDMVLPPGVRHVETRSRVFDRDVCLLALFPHMHLRGTSFTFEATYPDGRSETLLHVPRWDMDWQHRYVFAEPKRLPAGTRLTAIGRYDNSADNPNNPDPEATVRVGQQTSDEMLNGYYDFCLAEQDLTKSKTTPLWWLAAVLAASVLVLRLHRGIRNRTAK